MGAPPGGPPGYGGHRPPYPGAPPANYNGPSYPPNGPGYPPSGYPGQYPPGAGGPSGDQHSESNNDQRQKPVTPVTSVETTGPDGQPMHDESSQQSTLSQSSDNSGGRQTPKGNYNQVITSSYITRCRLVQFEHKNQLQKSKSVSEVTCVCTVLYTCTAPEVL